MYYVLFQRGSGGVIELRFCSTVNEALAVYTHLYKEQQQKHMVHTHDLFSAHIGSEKFKHVSRYWTKLWFGRGKP